MLINIKMPTIVGILKFMSLIDFMLSWAERYFFLASGPLLASIKTDQSLIYAWKIPEKSKWYVKECHIWEKE